MATTEAGTGNAPLEEFRCVVHEGRTGGVVEVWGDLDLATAPEAELRLRDLVRVKQHVALDLRGLAFMDSTGLAVIVRVGALAGDHGVRFSVVRGAPVVQRIIEIAGIDQHLAMVDAPPDLDA